MSQSLGSDRGTSSRIAIPVVSSGMTLRRQIIIAVLVLQGATQLAAAEPRRMVEITCDGQQRTGSVILHNDTTGWFLERDGRLDPVTLADVTQFRDLGRFQPWNIVSLREVLAREFGSGFTVHPVLITWWSRRRELASVSHGCSKGYTGNWW